MAYEHPNNSERPEDGKEKKSKKVAKHAPRHVPLPLSDKKVENKELASPVNEILASKQKLVEKPAEKPDTTTTETRADRTTAPDAEPKVDKTEQQPTPAEHVPAEAEHVAYPLEQEVSLHDGNEEVEVFLSDRLRAEKQQAVPEKSQDESTEDTLNVESTAQSAEQPKDDAVLPAKSAPKSQQTPRASAGPISAAAASSPFLNQWRQRGAPQGPSNKINPNIQPPSPTTPSYAPNRPAASEAVPSSHDVVPITSRPAPERVGRVSERRHLLTGLVVGGLIEHIRHRRREKRMTSQHKSEVKELGKQQQASQAEARQQRGRAERRQTELEKTISRLRHEFSAAQAPTKMRSAEAVSHVRVPERPQVAAVPTIEQAKKQFAEQAKKVIESGGIPPAEQPNLPANHRIETSAWHTIEVDKKTGKAVENPGFAYGEAFQQEQHQEQLRREIDEASLDSKVVREKYQAAKKVDSPLPSYQHSGPPVAARSSTKLKDTSSQLVGQAARTLKTADPIDIALWVVLAVIIVAILSLV